ncbi:MAG: ABC transporter permease [Terriglobales bacterium]|jgi:ABC-2 type transport system permease protein
MNTQSNATPDFSRASQESIITPTRPFYWSVRRELWENRSIYIAPLAVACLMLLGFLIATLGRALTMPNPVDRLRVLEEPFTFAMGLIMGTAFIVGIFYCLDALYGERRDRSILFWKSLPVSDLTTVLSKATVGVVILPLLAFVITVATQSIMLLVSTAVVRASGLDVAAFANKVALFRTSLALLYHLVTVHILWYAPFYGWLLLVSAWARRAPFLWAVLPPFAIGALEKVAFNTSHFAAVLHSRINGPEAVSMADNLPIDAMTRLTPGGFLASPGLWLGLIFAVACLAAAVRLRRYREPL